MSRGVVKAYVSNPGNARATRWPGGIWHKRLVCVWVSPA